MGAPSLYRDQRYYQRDAAALEGLHARQEITAIVPELPLDAVNLDLFEGRRSAFVKALGEVRKLPQDQAEARAEKLRRLLRLLVRWATLPQPASPIELPVSPLHGLWFALSQALIAAGQAEAMLEARRTLPPSPLPLMSIEQEEKLLADLKPLPRHLSLSLALLSSHEALRSDALKQLAGFAVPRPALGRDADALLLSLLILPPFLPSCAQTTLFPLALDFLAFVCDLAPTQPSVDPQAQRLKDLLLAPPSALGAHAVLVQSLLALTNRSLWFQAGQVARLHYRLPQGDKAAAFEESLRLLRRLCADVQRQCEEAAKLCEPAELETLKRWAEQAKKAGETLHNLT